MNAQYNDSGAHWLKCDLHVHTPFDRTKRFGENVRHAVQKADNNDVSAMQDMAFRFFDACQARELDLVVITDHNSVEGYQRFSAFLPEWQSKRECDLSVLPGVELTVGGERCLHLLLVAGKGVSPAWLSEQVIALFDGAPRHTERGEPNSCQKTTP